MTFRAENTDEHLLAELGARVAAERLAQNLTQAELAERAGLGLRTVQRLEAGASATQLSGLLRVLRVLGLVERLATLLPEPRPSPVALARERGRRRRRASPRKPRGAREEPWTWGDGR